MSKSLPLDPDTDCNDLDLSILIVSYKCASYVAACLRSLQAQLHNLRYEVIIVDNASGDDTVLQIQATGVPVRWIPLTTNVGFAGANNLAASRATGNYILLLNPDTELLSDCVSPVLEYLKAHPDVGLIGTHHEDRNGQWQRSFGPPVRLRDEYLYALRLPHRWTSRRSNEAPVAPISVGWLAGSFLTISKSVVDEVGLFDPRFFLNDEDIDLAVRVRKSGRSVIYHPVRGLRHFGGVSKASSPCVHREHFASRLRYYRKHHGILHAVGFVLCHWIHDLRSKAATLRVSARTGRLTG